MTVEQAKELIESVIREIIVNSQLSGEFETPDVHVDEKLITSAMNNILQYHGCHIPAGMPMLIRELILSVLKEDVLDILDVMDINIAVGENGTVAIF